MTNAILVLTDAEAATVEQIAELAILQNYFSEAHVGTHAQQVLSHSPTAYVLLALQAVQPARTHQTTACPALEP